MNNTAPIINPPESHLDGEDLQESLAANFDEMDDLMNSMGLGDSTHEPPKTKSSQPPLPPKPQQHQQHYDDDDDDDDDDDLDIDLR